MEIFNTTPYFTAFIRPAEGANVGLIRTSAGMVLIDTGGSPGEISGLLGAIHVHPDEISMVINTHFHTDHTWGNQLFSCPILAHRLCLEKMRSNLQGEWSREAFQAYLDELEKTDPRKAVEWGELLKTLKIKLPDQVFTGRYEGDLGDAIYQVIHTGGHTPDSAILYLPEERLLYASDLIFQGRYPYIFDADIPAWVEVLGRLKDYHAAMIIPGHGVPCTEADITRLSAYLQQTWQLTAEHIKMGHTLEQACADPAYPIFAPGKREKLHPANIRYMYEKLSQ
jgi:cyclase